MPAAAVLIQRVWAQAVAEKQLIVKQKMDLTDAFLLDNHWHYAVSESMTYW